MSNNNIPTAKKYIWQYDFINDLLCSKTPEKDLEHFIINFTKMHVEAALKAASETKILGYHSSGMFKRDEEDKESILNSYSLNNIK